jgi:hypothetical protein
MSWKGHSNNHTTYPDIISSGHSSVSAGLRDGPPGFEPTPSLGLITICKGRTMKAGSCILQKVTYTQIMFN